MEKKSPFEDNDYKAWADNMRKVLIPQMRDSASVLMIAPRLGGEFDVDFALQIGACIMLEKPVVLVVHTGRQIPPKLFAIADRIIEADLDSTTMNQLDVQEQIRQAFADLGKQ